jgi:tetratricopeptide (TPR) repeat protein
VKYNPRMKKYEDLKTEFMGVQRLQLYEDILDEIEKSSYGNPSQNRLITGARGMGKSHLITLLDHEIGLNLTRTCIPILFPEELRLDRNLGDFFLRTGKLLSHYLGDHVNILEALPTNALENLKRAIEKANSCTGDERFSTMSQALRAFSSDTQRNLLMLVENLQTLLGKQFSSIDQKRLRACLLEWESMTLIGTATTVLGSLSDHSNPFFHFFHLSPLEEFNIDEMTEWVRRSCKEKVIESKPQELVRTKIRAFHAYVGGNPRMGLLCAEILSEGGFTEEMLSSMQVLFDELTPYFERLFEDLPEHLKRVLDLFATAADPALSPAELAKLPEAEGEKEATLRNYVKKLKDGGYLKPVFSQGRSEYYRLSEYLYRIWFQMRDSSRSQDMQWLLHFLPLVFSREEISITLVHKKEVCGWIPSQSQLEKIYHQADRIRETTDYAPTESIAEPKISSGLKNTQGKAQSLQVTKAKDKEEEMAIAIFNKGVEYHKSNNLLLAIKAYDKLIARYGANEHPGVLEKVASAMLNRGIAYGELEGPEAGIKAYDELIDRYGESESPGILEQVLKAGYWRMDSLILMERYEEVLKSVVMNKSLEEHPLQRWLLMHKAFCLQKLGQESLVGEILLDILGFTQGFIFSIPEIVMLNQFWIRPFLESQDQRIWMQWVLGDSSKTKKSLGLAYLTLSGKFDLLGVISPEDLKSEEISVQEASYRLALWQELEQGRKENLAPLIKGLGSLYKLQIQEGNSGPMENFLFMFYQYLGYKKRTSISPKSLQKLGTLVLDVFIMLYEELGEKFSTDIQTLMQCIYDPEAKASKKAMQRGEIVAALESLQNTEARLAENNSVEQWLRRRGLKPSN